jgi:polar amino acid transport system substrate-binding protein
VKHLALLVVVFSAGPLSCGIPNDVEGTLDRVKGNTLRVGAIENTPWVTQEPEGAGGIEPEIVGLLAESLDARIEWITGGEEEILASLESHGLDLVIGGLTTASPWGANVTFTQTYATTRLTIAVPNGEPIPNDIDGLKISVEAGSEAEALLEEKTDAIPLPIEDISRAKGPAATDDWILDDLQLRDTGIHLVESQHVLAVANGENAWLVEVENFLLDHKDLAEKLIKASDDS